MLYEVITRQATGELRPGLTILLDIPLEEGLRRAIERNGSQAQDEGRFEQETLDFHRRVQDGYRRLAADEERS